MSSTAIGSTPANGSSSRMKVGRVPSARAISSRRRSPPESEIAACLRRWAMFRSLSSSPGAPRSLRREALQLEDRLHVLLHRQAAEHRVLLRQVGDAEARAAVDRQVRELGLRRGGCCPRRRDQADDHVEAGGLAGAVRAEQPDHLAARDSSETSCTTVRDL
jgi:hypothetical protein